VGRDDSLRSAYAAFTQRKDLRTKGLAHDRQRNHLPATITTTGGGKSFFLDELGALREEDLQLCEDLEMREILSNSVSLQINKYVQNVKFR
jgi:hypothetical protein